MTIARIRQYILTMTASLLGLALCLLVFLECVEIVLRYGFGTTLIWTTDVSALLLMLLGWLGAGHLWIAGKHLVVELFQGQFPHFFKWVGVIAEVLVLMGIIWLAPKIMDTLLIYADMVMPALEVSAAIRFFPLLTGLLLISLGSVLNVAEVIWCTNQPEAST